MTLRPALMLGCAAGALCLSGQARAQAFNGNPTTIAGTVGYDRATPGVETITLDSPSAIILWVPNVGGNPLVFLPSGRTATFINGISNSNFAVLNRIQANVPIRFDGTVLSRLVDAGTGTSAPGGTVIFESPGGIIVGPKALFDVGNLILTTLTVATDGGGNFVDASGAFHFSGGAKAGVIVEPGGQILANTQGSYVGLIAPVIQQGGTVRVNGSVAYVAAEDVEFRVNAGLFDIIVNAGSQNPFPLTHTGATGGPASTGAGDVHRIYMVAVPKNTAITAILQGSVGFDPAVVAGVENGAIVLSAGYSVVGGEPDRFADFTTGPVPGIDASFEIRGGTISSDLFGYAVTNMLANGSATGSLAFDQDVSLFGGVQAALSAGPNQVVTVGGNAFVSAAHFRTIKLNPIDLVGGTAQIFADGGGSVDISGNATVDASAQGVVNVVTSTAGHGTGGTAGLFANTGGSVRVRGDTQVLATGVGGMLDLSPNRGGTGLGGVALVEGRNGGQVQLDGTLAMDASGAGSRSNGSANPGATGTGGDAHVAAIGGGSVSVAGATSLTADGTGGEVTGGAIPGGTGQGGTVSLAAAGTVTLAGDPVLNANGFGGAGPTGGTAQGGTILLAATPVLGVPGGSALTAGNVTGTASATGAAATGNTPGEWHVTAGAGSLVDFANLTLTAAQNGPPAALPFSSLEALRGRINVTQTATLVTPADIRVIGDGAGRITGGFLDIDAGGDVTVSHTNRGANFTIDVTDLDIDGTNVTVAAGSATRASNRTDVAAGAAMTVGGVMDGREIVITSASADVLAGGSVGSATTELADIRATGNASVAGTILGGNILVASSALAVTGTGIIGGAATNQTELRTTGTSAIAGRVLGGSILITAADIDVAQTGAVGDATTQLTDIRATGNASVAGTILGRNILLASNGLTVAGTGIVGGGTTDQTELRATGTAAISGRVLGRSILATAAAVNVAASGAVGDATTQLTDIRATGNASVAGTILGRNILLASNGLTVAGTGIIGGGTTDQTELRATGTAAIAGRVLGGSILVTAASVNVAAGGAVGDASTQLTDIRATGNASVAGTILGRNILVASNGLTVAGTGIVGGAATDQTELRATGNAAIAGRVLGGSILITAADIDVASTGAIGDATTQLTDIRATGNASVAGTILGRNILLASNALTVTGTGLIGGGTTDQTELRAAGTAAISGRVLGRSILATAAAVNVAAGGAVGDATTQQADIRATGNATIAGTVLGGAINIQGATLIVPAGGTVGGAGTGQARLTALGNAGIAGRVLGRDIQIASADIDLTGAVGDAGTQLATLTVNPTTQAATLGGAVQGPGYTLTNAEAGRIRADTLTINVPALGTGPALFVRDLNFNGGGAAAGIGTLAIVTPGIARVEGNLLLANARAADGISFTANQRLEVVTPAGSIRVRDAAAAPGGTMALASNNLWVASAAIIDRLRLNPNYAGRDADLLDNEGADVPRGYVEANAVAINAGGTLFVQNTGVGLGTFATGLDFAGVTAGPGGLTIRSTGPAPAAVTAFGRRLNGDGSFTTGYDFFFAVNFAPAPGNFTAGSTFNTCIIPTGQCMARPPVNAIPGRDPTTGPTGGSDSVQLPPGAEGDDLVDTSFATEGLIEEPVTSGGESILWGGDCDRDDDGECDEVQP